jgi:glutamate formiminotransferase/glutamate formiminotransferase/formiminotetrahydrofolate cyclodeaminase
MSVPNVSEGRNEAVIEQIGDAFAHAPGSPHLLDVHSDADHHRSVFTLAAPQGALADAVIAGARKALEQIDVVSRAGSGPAADGQHPYVGAVDVVPVVYLQEGDRGAACAEALTIGDRLGQELGLPVFLYGELSAPEPGTGRTRAELRRGGISALAARMAGKDGDALNPDFGPPHPHPSAGATLVAARPPLVAFNLQLAPAASIEEARSIAARVREGGADGLPGLRAIAVELAGPVAQVSMNIERPFELPLAAVVEHVRRLGPVESAELVGLAPAAALEGFPDDVPIVGFDAGRHVIENALRC